MEPAIGLCRALLVTLIAGAAFLVPSVSDAQTEDVEIVINQTYNFREPPELTYKAIDNFELPLLDTIEDMVFATGRDVVAADDGTPAQTIIDVTVEGWAMNRIYLERDGQHLYTGAVLDGDVMLRTSSGISYHREFYSVAPMPFQLPTVDPGYDKPHNAPFSEAFEKPDGLSRALAEMMVEAWGVQAVVPAAYDAGAMVRVDVVNLLGDIGDPVVIPDLIDILETDSNDDVRWQAAWSLGRIGDQQALSHLIEALNDESQDVRWFAAWSLREITGETFGADYDAWADWWAEQELSVEG